MTDISRHKIELREKQKELRRLLNGWDPIGILGGPDAPTDEYDCLLGLIGKLRDGMTEGELGVYLTEQLRHHFGIDPTASRPEEFAGRVYAWYWQDPLPA
jgi:hypothetical protein